MIRLLSAYFPKRTLFLGLSEAFLVVLAFLGATILRLGATDATIALSYEQGLFKIAIVSATFITCMYYFDLYDSSILCNRRELLARLAQVLGAVCILLALLYYIYPAMELGRGIFVIGISAVAIMLLLWRYLFLAVNSQARFAERAVVFGDGPLARPLMRELESRPELGVRIVNHVFADDNRELDCARRETTSEALWTIATENLSTAVESQRVSRVIVAMADRRGKLPVKVLLSLKSRGVLIEDGSNLYEAITGKVPIESIRLGWLLFSPGFRVSAPLLTYKRLASVLISIAGLLLTLPLLPLVALAIKLTSAGPVFYHQKRVGRDGVVFDCYKLRTMRADAEADSGPTWAGDDDPRITPVGRFLRMSRLDEVPQLWNVLKGDMHIVGPRPERPEFVAWLAEEIPLYYLRQAVRPGITGWAQVRYEYASSVEAAKEKLRYDLFYIKNMSPGLDVLVFFQTIKIILLGRGAR